MASALLAPYLFQMLTNGVYRIVNRTNGNFYIGSCSSHYGLSQRWNVHKHELSCNKHHSQHLQYAWIKYGADAFVFEVLLYCAPQDCLMYEQIALDYFKPKYNIAKIAGSSLGTKRSPESKALMSRIQKGSKKKQPFRLQCPDGMFWCHRCMSMKPQEDFFPSYLKSRMTRCKECHYATRTR